LTLASSKQHQQKNGLNHYDKMCAQGHRIIITAMRAQKGEKTIKRILLSPSEKNMKSKRSGSIWYLTNQNQDWNYNLAIELDCHTVRNDTKHGPL